MQRFTPARYPFATVWANCSEITLPTHNTTFVKKCTPEELVGVWRLVAEHVARFRNTGRRRGCVVSGRDALFMPFTLLKHEKQWDFTVKHFEINRSTFKRGITELPNAVLKHTYEVWVPSTEEKWKIFKCIRNRKQFQTLFAAPES